MQRQVDLCEFKTNLVYRVGYRTARVVIQRNPLKKRKEKKEKRKKERKDKIPVLKHI